MPSVPGTWHAQQPPGFPRVLWSILSAPFPIKPHSFLPILTLSHPLHVITGHISIFSQNPALPRSVYIKDNSHIGSYCFCTSLSSIQPLVQHLRSLKRWITVRNGMNWKTLWDLPVQRPSRICKWAEFIGHIKGWGQDSVEQKGTCPSLASCWECGPNVVREDSHIFTWTVLCVECQ